MAVVVLRHPLRDLADGETRVEVDGSNVGEALNHLVDEHPRLKGWVLDEQGRIRRHVNVFVDGIRADAGVTVKPETELNIIQAISGGSGEAELLVGTRKGLFVLRGPRGGEMSIAGRLFEGSDVEFATRDSRSGRYYASVTSGHYGPHLHYSDDPLGEWKEAEGPAFPADTGATLVRTWVIQPGEEDGVVWAGTDPAALFKSTDGGESWELNRGLWDHPTRPQWQPGGGGLALHSICPWPGDPQRLAVGVSAAGVWLTDDGGESWRRSGKGITPRYVPEDTPEDQIPLCIHNMHRVPVEPETLYMQFHGGVYRSDDAGETWNSIAEGGLPSDFGFPMVSHPRDAQKAFVIPLNGDFDRVTPEGKLQVFETSNRGESWSSTSDGLPSEHAYLTILRLAFAHDGGDPLGLYFGATSGDVFGSADEGRSWSTVARHLPPVLSVRASS
jgi:photosystem II stability/assembly factor-like uncharacterized protein